MPYDDEEMMDDEIDAPISATAKMENPAVMDKGMMMGSMITMLGKMKGLMQDMMETKDMSSMPEVMGMMARMEGLMKKIHGGSHYQKE